MRQIGGEVSFVMFLLTAFITALNIVAINCLIGLNLKFLKLLKTLIQNFNRLFL